MRRISWTEYKTHIWVRLNIGVQEENALLGRLKNPGSWSNVGGGGKEDVKGWLWLCQRDA